MGLLVLFVVGPLNLLVRRKPQDIGLLPDGGSHAADGTRRPSNIVDPAWTSIDWTLARAMSTGRFWWIVLAYFCGLFAWYAVQVHQTKYLIEVGFSPLVAAWALGMVSVVAIPGQIGLGALSDRVGREWVWSAGCCGFAVCYAAPGVRADVCHGANCRGDLRGTALRRHLRHDHGRIDRRRRRRTLDKIHDATGSYRLAFLLAVACCVISVVAIWIASPRRVRMVPGRIESIGSAPSGA